MQRNDIDIAREKKVKEKSKFYFKEKLKAHVLIIPEGFRNGLFVSDLIDNTYYLFKELNGAEKRLFISEIYDIEDYKEKGGQYE